MCFPSRSYLCTARALQAGSGGVRLTFIFGSLTAGTTAPSPWRDLASNAHGTAATRAAVQRQEHKYDRSICTRIPLRLYSNQNMQQQYLKAPCFKSAVV